MTAVLPGKETAARIEAKFPGVVTESALESVVVKAESLLDVARFLKETEQFDMLSWMTGVDYGDYFEIVYSLVSTTLNHALTLKTRCFTRDNPTVPSVVSLWKGAELQERETFDLMGIRFEGHPNLRRIVLWEGYEGYPLRKDFWQWPS